MSCLKHGFRVINGPNNTYKRSESVSEAENKKPAPLRKEVGTKAKAFITHSWGVFFWKTSWIAMHPSKEKAMT
jgi:hypothetical protein